MTSTHANLPKLAIKWKQIVESHFKYKNRCALNQLADIQPKIYSYTKTTYT